MGDNNSGNSIFPHKCSELNMSCGQGARKRRDVGAAAAWGHGEDPMEGGRGVLIFLTNY